MGGTSRRWARWPARWSWTPAQRPCVSCWLRPPNGWGGSRSTSRSWPGSSRRRWGCGGTGADLSRFLFRPRVSPALVQDERGHLTVLAHERDRCLHLADEELVHRAGMEPDLLLAGGLQEELRALARH